MIKVILLVFLFVVCAVTEDAETQPSSASSKQEYFGSLDKRGTFHKNNNQEFTDAEVRILQDVFSPDYYEPNIILDYRYMKTGGRGYARGDGGQILILPTRNHMPSPQNNYDTLLEYLRLKHLEQISKPFLPNSRLRQNDGEYNDDILRENSRESMSENISGYIRENMGGNMRENMGENMRENMGGNMRENIRGNMRDILKNDRRNMRYRNEKLDRHDIEDKFRSEAELGLALYNH